MTDKAAAPTLHRCGTRVVTLADATCVGGRDADADAACTEANPLGIGAVVIDGIGSSPAGRAPHGVAG